MPWERGGTTRFVTVGRLQREYCLEPLSCRLHELPASAASAGRFTDGDYARSGLFAAEDGVLGCLGDTELDHPLGRNLDLFTGLRIASDSGLPVTENKLS